MQRVDSRSFCADGSTLKVELTLLAAFGSHGQPCTRLRWRHRLALLKSHMTDAYPLLNVPACNTTSVWPPSLGWNSPSGNVRLIPSPLETFPFWSVRGRLSQLEDLVLSVPQILGQSGDGERHSAVCSQLLPPGGRACTLRPGEGPPGRRLPAAPPPHSSQPEEEPDHQPQTDTGIFDNKRSGRVSVSTRVT